MAGLRIPTIDGYSAIDVRAMLREHGVAVAGLKQVNVPDTVDSLVNGSVDVIINYTVSAQHRAQELDVTLNSLHPADWGVQSYSDTLYTTGALARTNPALLERFVRASLQGWRYAIEHREEIADRISMTLPRYIYKYSDVKGYNRTFAQLIDEYTLYPEVELGAGDRFRWQQTYTLLRAGDFILEPYDISSLFPTAGDEGFPSPDSGAVERKQPLIAGIALLVAVVAGLLWRRMEFRNAAFVTCVLIIAAEQFVEWGYVGERTRQQRLAVVEQLSSLRARLDPGERQADEPRGFRRTDRGRGAGRLMPFGGFARKPGPWRFYSACIGATLV